jgi:hypothetical protein
MVADAKKGSFGVPVEVSPMRFRPNLVISGGKPYAEDGWRNLKIGDNYFTVSSLNFENGNDYSFYLCQTQKNKLWLIPDTNKTLAS